MKREEIANLIVAGKYSEAEQEIEALANITSDDVAKADVSWLRGLIAHQRNEWAHALSKHEEARSIYQELGNPLGQANALNSQGAALRMLDRYKEALSKHEEAWSIYQELGDRFGLANALDSQGNTLRMLGQYEEALSKHEEAWSIYQELGERLGLANALSSQGDALRMLDRYAEALSKHEEALSIYQELGDRFGQANALSSQGDALRMLDRYEEALSKHEEARSIYQELGNRLGQANAASGMARSLEHRGLIKAAADEFAKAASLYRDLGMAGFADVASRSTERLRSALSGESTTPEQAAVDAFLRDADEQVARLLERVEQSNKEIEAFLTRQSTHLPCAFVSCREWNSWQPLAPARASVRGGGYLLRWGGHSLAIDPGPGFLSNLDDAGFGLADIDGVLITHNHIDHVAELPYILTLIHEYNELHPDKRRKLDLFLAPSVFQAYAGMVVPSANVGRLERLMPKETVLAPEYGLRCTPFRANHAELGQGQHAVSIAFELLDPGTPEKVVATVALTGDTGWAEDLGIVQSLPDMPRPILLVAHLGSVLTSVAGSFHASHLEYRGIATLLSRLKDKKALPDCLVVSEFGLECKPVVCDIVRGLQTMVGDDIQVCAGLPGRAILLPDMTIACDFIGSGGKVCCKPSTWRHIADDLLHFIYRCEEHVPK